MAELEPIPDEDEFYLARGAEISVHRPICTGDVFAGVKLPAKGEKLRKVIIVSHPCVIRNGPVLRERLLVAEVQSRKLTDTDWQHSHYQLCPLPGLLPKGGNDGQVASFDDLEVVSSGDLRTATRVAVLSMDGIAYMFQRWVYSQTRWPPKKRDFVAALDGPLTEVDLTDEWIEIARRYDIDGADAERAAHTWFVTRDETQSRQERLADPLTRRVVAAQMRAHVAAVAANNPGSLGEKSRENGSDLPA